MIILMFGIKYLDIIKLKRIEFWLDNNKSENLIYYINRSLSLRLRLRCPSWESSNYNDDISINIFSQKNLKFIQNYKAPFKLCNCTYSTIQYQILLGFQSFDYNEIIIIIIIKRSLFIKTWILYLLNFS